MADPAATTGQPEPVRDSVRTRTRAVWVAMTVAIVLLALLIIFIAQNNKTITVHYLGASGRISQALALLIAAAAGAALVALAGAARILQLRLAVRRTRKAVVTATQQTQS